MTGDAAFDFGRHLKSAKLQNQVAEKTIRVGATCQQQVMAHCDPRIETLERQVRSLRLQVRRLEEWIDTISSPPWKRALFVAQGFRLWRLGVWYRAPWNRSAWKD